MRRSCAAVPRWCCSSTLLLPRSLPLLLRAAASSSSSSSFSAASRSAAGGASASRSGPWVPSPSPHPTPDVLFASLLADAAALRSSAAGAHGGDLAVAALRRVAQARVPFVRVAYSPEFTAFLDALAHSLERWGLPSPSPSPAPPPAPAPPPPR
jgi:hypothetical protein